MRADGARPGAKAAAAGSGNDDAARHELEEDHAKTLFLIAGLTALPFAAEAKTEISWWHAMTGANGEVVTKIASDFNASQSDYELKPVFKGHLSRNAERRHRRLPCQTAPDIIQVFDVGTG